MGLSAGAPAASFCPGMAPNWRLQEATSASLPTARIKHMDTMQYPIPCAYPGGQALLAVQADATLIGDLGEVFILKLLEADVVGEPGGSGDRGHALHVQGEGGHTQTGPPTPILGPQSPSLGPPTPAPGPPTPSLGPAGQTPGSWCQEGPGGARLEDGPAGACDHIKTCRPCTHHKPAGRGTSST